MTEQLRLPFGAVRSPSRKNEVTDDGHIYYLTLDEVVHMRNAFEQNVYKTSNLCQLLDIEEKVFSKGLFSTRPIGLNCTVLEEICSDLGYYILSLQKMIRGQRVLDRVRSNKGSIFPYYVWDEEEQTLALVLPHKLVELSRSEDPEDEELSSLVLDELDSYLVITPIEFSDFSCWLCEKLPFLTKHFQEKIIRKMKEG